MTQSKSPFNPASDHDDHATPADESVNDNQIKDLPEPIDNRSDTHELIPSSLHQGLTDIIKTTRERLRDSDRVGPISDVISKNIAPDIQLDKEAMERLVKIIQKHIEDFPEEPKDGFNTLAEYERFSLDMNRILAEERRLFNQNPLLYHAEDPEMPGKKQSRVLVECADGRNSPALFLDKGDLLKRYSTRWLPFAGLIIVPEIENGLSEQELAKLFQTNPDLQNMIFKRLDLIFGVKVERFVQRKAASTEVNKLYFEFQSHFDAKHFPHHGCGAHCSDFNKAQAETIKDCFLVDQWLKDRYPEYYQKDYFKVYRTGHDTGDGGDIYSGTFLDETRITPEYRASHKDMLDQAAEKFSPPATKNQPYGVFKSYKKNHLDIDVEEHDEQSIRISNQHYAHTLIGQSVLEISWTDNPEILFKHLQVLLSIIEKNFRKNNNPKPAIIHLDIPKGREEIASVYLELMSKLQSDPEMKKRLDEGSLQIFSTQTDAHTYITSKI